MRKGTRMTQAVQAVHVVGVGMIPFTKPGASEACHLLGRRAAKLAPDDAGIAYSLVQQADVGCVFGDSTAGQAAVYGLGLSGIPVVNVNNDCATGSAAQVYAAAGIGPEDVDLVELHDCFTANELISCESLGLTPEGAAEQFILDGDNTYRGRVVTNPSGGLLGKGHTLDATGLAQCAELTWQLRGQAQQRQVEGARWKAPGWHCNTTWGWAALASPLFLKG